MSHYNLLVLSLTYNLQPDNCWKNFPHLLLFYALSSFCLTDKQYMIHIKMIYEIVSTVKKEILFIRFMKNYESKFLPFNPFHSFDHPMWVPFFTFYEYQYVNVILFLKTYHSCLKHPINMIAHCKFYVINVYDL